MTSVLEHLKGIIIWPKMRIHFKNHCELMEGLRDLRDFKWSQQMSQYLISCSYLLNEVISDKPQASLAVIIPCESIPMDDE